jgi:uncharacterized protein (TIGR02217 family)
MSNLLYPKLASAVGWSLTLSPMFNNDLQESVDGSEVRTANWPYPIWEIGLEYVLLKDEAASVDDTGATPLAKLTAFYGQHFGGLDSFLLNLTDLTKRDADSQINGALLGVGDGTTTKFKLVRQIRYTDALGNVVALNDLIQNPAGGVVQVHVEGTSPDPVQNVDYTVDRYGVVTFTSAPTAAMHITADFVALWRCRFNTKELAKSRSNTSEDLVLERFLPDRWKLPVSLVTVINA